MTGEREDRLVNVMESDLEQCCVYTIRISGEIDRDRTPDGGSIAGSIKADGYVALSSSYSLM